MPYDPYDEYDLDGYNDPELRFANPGSALRAQSRTNPRNLPCPTCGRENMLTPADVNLGYQCDYCADAAEGGYDY